MRDCNQAAARCWRRMGQPAGRGCWGGSRRWVMQARAEAVAMGDVVPLDLPGPAGGKNAPTKRVGEARKGSTKRVASTKLVHLRRSEVRTIWQFIAALAAGFLPLASYILAHYETKDAPAMWGLVAAALTFSAPTLVEWAQKWCRSLWKAIGFTVLLEGVMVASSTTWLGLTGLVILVAINCHAAWSLAGKDAKRRT